MCRQVVKATVEHLSEHREKLESEYSELELEQGGSKRQVSVGSQPTEQQIETAEGESAITLGNLIQEYREYQIKHGNWNPTVVRNHRPKCNALLSFFGDAPVTQITKDQMRTYRKLLGGVASLLCTEKSLQGFVRN